METPLNLGYEQNGLPGISKRWASIADASETIVLTPTTLRPVLVQGIRGWGLQAAFDVAVELLLV